MSAESYLLSVIRGDRRGAAASALRAGLSLLSYVYNGGLNLFLLPYRIGIRKQTRLGCPVISVGNLTVGGTGKTPMTQLLCEFLQGQGLKVCVLNRGYRGGSEHGVAVVSDGKRVLLDAKSAGDEAHMLAQLLRGIPVIAGKDRRESGRLAVEQFRPDVIVLDDGMQFYQLHRDLDIVLVNAQRPFDNGWTLPRGLLREPPTHIRRAGCVVITHADRVDSAAVEALKQQIGSLAPGRPVYTASHEVVGLRALDRSSEEAPAWLEGKRIAALCGLGNPVSFREQLEREGAQVVHWTEFPDHHEPTLGEIHEVIATACAAEVEAIVVTEKDAVKIPPLMRPLPFYALQVRLALDNAASFFQQALQVIRR
jgi:tetraacyldisaccharide 4'-kinase